MLSGGFCGLAGALQALHLSIVPIEILHYDTSGIVVMIALLGGMGTFFGPMIGDTIPGRARFQASETAIGEVLSWRASSSICPSPRQHRDLLLRTCGRGLRSAMQFDRFSATRAVMRWVMTAFYAIDWPSRRDLG